MHAWEHCHTNSWIYSAGYTPIVTCSPVNNALCESYGAAACFDYHSPTCGADIREYTANNLAFVFDCVTDTETMKMCYEAIGSSGGKYIAIEAIDAAIKYTRRDVVADWMMAPTIMGTRVEIGGTYGRPSTPEHRRFGSGLFLLVEKLLNDGALKGHPVELREGGLADIPGFINRVRVRGIQAKRQVVPLLVD
jgi:NADPH:quinone reductase-like Zn-dependent oxidoreductase